MTKRHQNNGLRKVCGCPRRQWSKCKHPWHLNFKTRGGKAYRLSLDRYLGRPIDSKSKAEAEAEKIRTLIRERKFGQAVAREDMTLRQLADTYKERYVDVERQATAVDFRSGLNVICGTVLPNPTGGSAPFGEWRLLDIVTDTIERYREARRGAGAGIGGANRSLSRLRVLLNWALRVGYLEHTPFKRHTVTVVKLSRETARSRRLQSGEEDALLAACGPHLRAVVECALETGMRRGEILELQWNQIEGLTVDGSKLVWASRAQLFLPAWKTKTNAIGEFRSVRD
jgi:integrase